MISADCHAQEPSPYLGEYIDAEFRHRIPHMERRDDGSEWMITEGNRPQLVKRGEKTATVQEQQSFEKAADNRHHQARMEPEDVLRNKSGPTIEERIADQRARRHRHRADLPEQGPAVLGDARPGVRRRHVPGVEPLGVRLVRRRRRLERRHDPAAGLDRHRRRRAGQGRGDVGRRARLRRPVPRQQPGLRAQAVGQPRVQRPGVRDVLGAATPRPGCRSRSTCRPGRDPRAVGGNGGAIINYVCHSMETTIEPLVQLITSGVFERHPDLQAGMVESRHRLRAVAARDDGLRLQGAPLLGPPGDPGAAVVVLPAQLLRHVPGGPRRPGRRPSATTSSTT